MYVVIVSVFRSTFGFFLLGILHAWQIYAEYARDLPVPLSRQQERQLKPSSFSDAASAEPQAMTDVDGFRVGGRAQ